MLCGHCGGLFLEAAKLAHHINRRGFRFEQSKIKNYNRETFDPNQKFELKPEAKATDSPPSQPSDQTNSETKSTTYSILRGKCPENCKEK